MGRKEAHKADKLTFQHSFKSLPKRGILSLVASSFDPLGNCNTDGFRGETYNSVYKAAEHLLILTAQKDMYNRQYNILKESKELPTNNKLLSFRPIIKNNLIRIGGRLSKSHLTYESKHQILLNNDHPLTRILFQCYHEKVHHVGPEQTLAETREKVWIVEGRGLLKKVIKDCLHCKRIRTEPIPPLMCDLPYARIEIG